jgi:hypothetical protein
MHAVEGVLLQDVSPAAGCSRTFMRYDEQLIHGPHKGLQAPPEKRSLENLGGLLS